MELDDTVAGVSDDGICRGASGDGVSRADSGDGVGRADSGDGVCRAVSAWVVTESVESARSGAGARELTERRREWLIPADRGNGKWVSDPGVSKSGGGSNSCREVDAA